jgi:cadmium resistance protein CadD (predicted permease)
MYSLLAIVPVTAAAFIATNLDNFVLLVSLLARYRSRTLAVASAYLVCMFIVGAVGFLIGEAANSAPVEYLGFLGLIPISIGVIGILRLLSLAPDRGSGDTSGIDSGHTVFVTTLLAQLGNAADTIVTFGILFADSLQAADYLILLTLMVMAGLFVFAAAYAVRHPNMSQVIERYADRVTPFILLFVGVYVLMNTGTDLVAD